MLLSLISAIAVILGIVLVWRFRTLENKGATTLFAVGVFLVVAGAYGVYQVF